MKKKSEIAIEKVLIFEEYLETITHGWLKTLTILGSTLVAVFFILDYFMLPIENLERFGLYRLSVTLIILIQHFIIRNSLPGKRILYHAYFFSGVVTLMISLMTVDLGGFESSYYAGINLVIIATVLVIPWSFSSSVINVMLIVFIYVAANLWFYKPFQQKIFLNNLYFILSTGIIAVAINFVQSKLIKKEFFTRKELKHATDALMGEMEIAKKIQTRLLPKHPEIEGYEISAAMITAAEVGGDYYDVIASPGGAYLAIGDVAGHGVDSGLIMMMTQTSISTLIKKASNNSVSEILEKANGILNENIQRLGIDRYVTLMILKLEPQKVTFAGKHQDLKVYRAASGLIETFSTSGTWIGALKDIVGVFTDTEISIASGDTILLFTDGATEAMNSSGKMYTDEKLDEVFKKSIVLPAAGIVEAILADITGFQSAQTDDLTLIVCRKK